MFHIQQPLHQQTKGDGVVQYQDSNDLSFLSIENAHATATIALQGAHVMLWQPKKSQAASTLVVEQCALYQRTLDTRRRAHLLAMVWCASHR